MYKYFYCLGFFGIIWANAFAQNIKTISTKKAYKQLIATNQAYTLVNVKTLKPAPILDLRYATTNNFTATNLYTKATTTYLAQPAAIALQQVITALAAQHIGIKIYDAYRPYTATKLMWTLIHDDRYVANPANGSNHNRGLSVDLTLVTDTGTELQMGTAFDNFTDTAHHSFTALPYETLANRRLLKTTMEQFGFTPLATEWWHYTYKTSVPFEVIDLSFATLLKLVKN